MANRSRRPQPATWESARLDVLGQALDAESACRVVRDYRVELERVEREVVTLGRSAGLSWFALGVRLGVLPETLRRRYA